VGNHDFVPQLARLQVTYQVVVDHGKFARQVGLDVQVAVVGFDAGRHTNNVRYGGRWRNGNAVGVAHAVLLDMTAQRLPVQRAPVVNFDVAAAFVTQHGQCVLGQDAAIPQGPLEAGIGAALGGQFAGSPVSVIAGGFHGAVRELDGGIRCKRHAHHVQAILEAHDAHTDRAMTHVGVACFGHGVVVDVDDVIKHAHGDADRALELFVVQHVLAAGVLLQVGGKVDRAQVAHGDLGVAGVQRDLGAQVRAVHDTDVLLGRADVARVLEGDP